jgi:hypothetical protein
MRPCARTRPIPAANTSCQTSLKHPDAVIQEGSSAIEFSNPDKVIFKFGKGKKCCKPGIEELAAGGDIVLCDADTQLPECVVNKAFSERPFRKRIQGFFRYPD